MESATQNMSIHNLTISKNISPFSFSLILAPKIKSNTRFEYTVGKVSSFRAILAIQLLNPTKFRPGKLTKHVSKKGHVGKYMEIYENLETKKKHQKSRPTVF